MRIALGIEYDGHEFYGWQAQAGLSTVQGHLEVALSTIANEPIRLFCAGRTDAGVHATGQVVHFETNAVRSERAWVMGTNSHLPPTIAVQFAKEVDEQFHARFSATARRYRYIIYNHSVRCAILASRVTWYHHSLNADTMHEAAQYLLGENDFSSFRASQCDSRSPMRNVHAIQVHRQGHLVIIDIEANAFLHHMVRNIVGVLLKIGSGFAEPIWMQEVLALKDRTKASETAPGTGLYLTNVTYPPLYLFPKPVVKELFISGNSSYNLTF